MSKSGTETSAIRPFLKWAGGKGQLLTTFESLLPKELDEKEGWTYIEPFVGGGAMLFYMLERFPKMGKVVANDINPLLINTYLAVRNDCEALIDRLKAWENVYKALSTEEERKAMYLKMRQEFNASKEKDTAQAARFIFLNKTCFNGLYRVNSKGLFNVPVGRYKHPTICPEETLRADSVALQRVEFHCGDFEKLANKAEAETFVYCDPPYRPLDATSNFNSYAREPFNDDEQKRLKCFADRLSREGAKVMLSNSDGRVRNPQESFFDDLYVDYHIERVLATRAVNAKADGRGKITELVIRNYE